MLKSSKDPPPPLLKEVVALSDTERELTTGLLARDASFRLIVSGRIGPKEIDRLIAKLKLDRDILSEPEAEIDTGPHKKEADPG